MRGKGGRTGSSGRYTGITPAYAGKRCRSPAFRSMPWDYPRMCGEKCPPGKFFFMTVGSPPRVRGKDLSIDLETFSSGITPACAGKSGRHALRHVLDGDHPRVCGEKPFSQLDSTVPPGSPPRVRGKAWGRCCPDRLRWDHPRVCGEKRFASASLDAYWGSPPRMRGKENLTIAGLEDVGITPACAGKRLPYR